MPDEQLDILIRTLADTYGAKQVEDSLRGLTKQTTTATEETHKLNLKGHELRELMHSLNRVVPGAGLALKGVFNPELIGVLALVLAVQKLVEHMQKVREEAKKAADESTKAFVASAQAAQAWSDKIADTDEKLVNSLKQLQEQQRGVEAVVKTVNDALDHQKQVLIAIAKVRGDDAKAAEQIELETDKKKLQLMRDELAAREKGAEADEKERTAARQALTGGAFEGGKVGLARLTMQQQQEALDRLQRQLQEAKTPQERAQIEGSIRETLGVISRAKATISGAEQRLEDVERRIVENEKRMAQLRPEIGRAAGDVGTREAAAGLEAGQGVSGIVARGTAAIEFARQHGGKISAEQMRAIQGLYALLTAIGAANKLMVESLVRASTDIEQLNAKVNLIRQRQDAVSRSLGY